MPFFFTVCRFHFEAEICLILPILLTKYLICTGLQKSVWMRCKCTPCTNARISVTDNLIMIIFTTFVQTCGSWKSGKETLKFYNTFHNFLRQSLSYILLKHHDLQFLLTCQGGGLIFSPMLKNCLVNQILFFNFREIILRSKIRKNLLKKIFPQQ